MAKKCFLIDLRIWKDQLPRRRMKYGLAFTLSLMLMCLHVPNISKFFFINPSKFVRGYLLGGGVSKYDRHYHNCNLSN